jgi:ATP-dependent DNA helicase 2 subunit 2
VPEFKQALATARDPAEIERATRQMGDAIVALIRRGHNSPAGAGAGGDSYGRVLEALRVMREELVAYEEPRRYNEFVRGLKAQLLAADGGGSGGLGGGSDDRRELWWQARRARLGLVTQRESDESDATEEEGMQVRLRKENMKPQPFF